MNVKQQGITVLIPKVSGFIIRVYNSGTETADIDNISQNIDSAHLYINYSFY